MKTKNIDWNNNTNNDRSAGMKRQEMLQNVDRVQINLMEKILAVMDGVIKRNIPTTETGKYEHGQ